VHLHSPRPIGWARLPSGSSTICRAQSIKFVRPQMPIRLKASIEAAIALIPGRASGLAYAGAAAIIFRSDSLVTGAPPMAVLESKIHRLGRERRRAANCSLQGICGTSERIRQGNLRQLRITRRRSCRAHLYCPTQAGLEVWFDKGELRGGEAWDASIRKQVKGCQLFLPIISANTQAREEGYFRREWKPGSRPNAGHADGQGILAARGRRYDARGRRSRAGEISRTCNGRVCPLARRRLPL